jgi:uncharacterized membrane protein YbhN (UPF0104 family)
VVHDAPEPRDGEADRDEETSGDGQVGPEGEAGAGGTGTALRRVLRLVRGLATRRRASPANQRLVLALSAVVFVVATVAAARNLPPIEGDVRWGFFVVVGLLGVPARIWVTGEEFAALARLTGHDVGRVERLRVALVGIAANMLPLPGSILVRGEVLRRRGAKLRTIGWATAMIGAMSAATTALVAGILLAALSDRRPLGLAIAVVGAGASAGVGLAIMRRRELTQSRRQALYLFAVEVMFIGLAGLRLWGIMLGLGFSVGVEQAMALTVAGVVTAAVGFAPGGLGVRELLVAGISPIVGLPVSVGVLAAAINRLVEMVVLAPVSVGMVLHPERIPAEEPFPDERLSSPS